MGAGQNYPPFFLELVLTHILLLILSSFKFSIVTMPVVRNVRRSRRLSNLPPRSNVGYDGDDLDELQLLIAASESASLQLPLDTLHQPVPSLIALDLPTDDQSCPSTSTKPEPSAYRSACRISHSRKKLDGHIPRPPNAFMCFRSDLWAKEKNKSNVERDHRMISRIAGQYWNRLSERERGPFKRQAELAKRRHAEIYPEYKYSPVYRKEKSPKRESSSRGGGNRKGCKTAGSSLIAEADRVDNIDDVEVKIEGGGVELVEGAHLWNSQPTRHSPAAAMRRKSRKLPAAHGHPSSSLTTSDPPRTPELTFPPPQGFVPTDEIPPLDLNNTAKAICKRPDMTGLVFMPPEYDPHCVESRFSNYLSDGMIYPPEDPIPRATTPMLADLYRTYAAGCFDDSDTGASFSSPSLDSLAICFTDPFAANHNPIQWLKEEKDFTTARATLQADENVSPLDIPVSDSVDLNISDWVHDYDIA